MPHSNLKFKWLQPERTEPLTPRRSPAPPDAEIGRLWHKHLPKRHDDLDSRQICYGILAISYEAALRDGPTDINTPNDALKAARESAEKISTR
jgi:hypothetical protein